MQLYFIKCFFGGHRYGIDAQLTVTKIETAGTAVSPMRLYSSDHELLTIKSDIYVGGLSRDYPDRVSITLLKLSKYDCTDLMYCNAMYMHAHTLTYLLILNQTFGNVYKHSV